MPTKRLCLSGQRTPVFDSRAAGGVNERLRQIDGPWMPGGTRNGCKCEKWESSISCLKSDLESDRQLFYFSFLKHYFALLAPPDLLPLTGFSFFLYSVAQLFLNLYIGAEPVHHWGLSDFLV